MQRHFGITNYSFHESSRDELPMTAAHRSVRGSRQLFIGPTRPGDRAPSRAAASEEGPDQPSITLLFPARSPHAAFADARINQRIDSLPCPAFFSIFPGRQARFPQDRPLTNVAQVPRTRIPPNYNDRPGRGFTAGWIMREGPRVVRSWKWEVIERWGDGGGGEEVNGGGEGRANKNWLADGHR
jgi:hypothetical protein